MHTRPLLLLAAVASLLTCLPAYADTPQEAKHVPAMVTVTDKDNEGNVTLYDKDTLHVQLPSYISAGYVWHVLTQPDDPLQMSGFSTVAPTPHVGGFVGSPTKMEYVFDVPRRSNVPRAFYLRLMSLRPFEKGIKNARFWEIKVTIPAGLGPTEPITF
jgi:predicted secreted protein